MDLLLTTLKMDWPVLLPILVCSVITLMVLFERWKFYADNRRDVMSFIQRLQRELQAGSLNNAQIVCNQVGGIIGEVAEQGVQLLAEKTSHFENSFDITINLANRKLEKGLSILGTIGGIAPFLGLFGTVVRILLTFGLLSKSSGQSSEVAFGIGSALIATAFGLGVAIVAVILYNYFNSKVGEFEDDFQLLKLLFLNAQENNKPAAMAI
jgi:biopolymer transport protein ExbB